ncbi:ras-associating and dilute domain-containing protein [Gouania willdenowi]|uniref:ras-associating and dilute domain-containing protein n=1 Tax=Gouania willdenowi TaxID=441366 RepID=UPI001056D8B1|nr:ras-associating and dilute domain-containing protein-like [Gouania willdenowi]
MRSSLPPGAPGAPTVTPRTRSVWPGRESSHGSLMSASSIGSSSISRSSDSSRSRIRRHANRLSGVFLRRPAAPTSASMSLRAGLQSSQSTQARKESMILPDGLTADDPSELSNQITAPGILKIFGNEICEGAHYKSVLASTQSSAKELVKEALERYGLGKETVESYILCDTIGSIGSHQWKTEGFRVVGDHEKPLLLQSLWKPREGLARRFELQKRSSVEEKTSKEMDTITAGINAQARKLQKSRSRVTSTLIQRTAAHTHKLWRSKSELDILDVEIKVNDAVIRNPSGSLNQSLKQNGIHYLEAPCGGDGGQSSTDTEVLCPPTRGPRAERGPDESEREETESSRDSTTLYSIHPPHECPYLLLLQGCTLTQDYVIYLLTGPDVVIGGESDDDDGPKANILLSAGDLLLRHCSFHRSTAGDPTWLRPFQGAVVTRNGLVLKNEEQLNPGDVIGLGKHYLFLFKDPLAIMQQERNPILSAPWMLSQTTVCASSQHGESLLCSTCNDLQSCSCKEPPFLKSPTGSHLTLSYDTKHEAHIVREIVAMGTNERSALSVSFLLCMCLQHSAAYLHISDLHRFLLLMARELQNAVWEQTKALAVLQPEDLCVDCLKTEDIPAVTVCELILGLRPLVVWMSNSLELLQIIQRQLPLILEWRLQKAQQELQLTWVHSATEETIAVLEEVVMLTFQQCVYYITKVLYPILPGLLDHNPFRDCSSESSPSLCDADGLKVAAGIQQVLDLLNESDLLFSDCQVHPEISSQFIGYLFYFINASLLNSLLERGSEQGFYQWSKGIQIQANLDLILDWAHSAGLGELALEQTQALCSAINVLATPRKILLQASWESLRSDFPALRPSQLNHLLALYWPASTCRALWAPCAQDQEAAHRTDDILESFDTQHPLVLPDGGYQLQLRRPVTDVVLRKELDLLKETISTFSEPEFKVVTSEIQFPQDSSIHTLTTSTEMDILPEASIQSHPTAQNEVVLTPTSIHNNTTSPPTSADSLQTSILTLHLDEFTSRANNIWSHSLRKLELKSDEGQGSSLDASCLLTPPNTPHKEDPDLMNPEHVGMKTDEKYNPWISASHAHAGGGLVSECLAALTVEPSNIDSCPLKRLVELKEEEEQEEEEYERRDDSFFDELFSLELERGEQGLGLALFDTRDTSLPVKGIFIRAVVPESPAALSEKLLAGDRILAVNGVSLFGLDYHSGRELIQSAAPRLRLLVARSEWMTKALQAECSC